MKFISLNLQAQEPDPARTWRQPGAGWIETGRDPRHTQGLAFARTPSQQQRSFRNKFASALKEWFVTEEKHDFRDLDGRVHVLTSRTR